MKIPMGRTFYIYIYSNYSLYLIERTNKLLLQLYLFQLPRSSPTPGQMDLGGIRKQTEKIGEQANKHHYSTVSTSLPAF